MATNSIQKKTKPKNWELQGVVGKASKGTYEQLLHNKSLLKKRVNFDVKNFFFFSKENLKGR